MYSEKIQIGDKYKDRKTGRVMEVTEKYTVYNSKNEIVRVYYSAKGVDLPIIAGEVCGITILKNKIESF
jgi:hypothetical protein